MNTISASKSPGPHDTAQKALGESLERSLRELLISNLIKTAHLQELS
jgi:hypothetical protein